MFNNKVKLKESASIMNSTSHICFNLSKSTISPINVDNCRTDVVCNLWGLKKQYLPIPYLGMEKYWSDFLWKNKNEDKLTHLLRWSKVTLPIEKCGLGIHKIADTNFSFLCKWL